MMSVLASIELRNSWWLLLALQPLAVLGIALLLRHRRRDEFADAHLLPWVRSAHSVRRTAQWLQLFVLWLAWGLLALAMAGPRIAQGIIEADPARAIEVQVVVDVSRSMSARDVVPSRIERSRLELIDLIERMQQVRLGLIVYAARAHVILPATGDKAVLRHAVGLLHTRQLPTEGSDLPGALRFAAQQLQPSARPRAILLLSDGELPAAQAQSLQALLEEFKQADIRVFVLGMGTTEGAPLLSEAQGWLQHEGQAVVSRLHRERLQALAEGGNGRYADVSDDDADWQVLYHEGIARLATATRDADKGENMLWRDLSVWFVLPGALLLVLAYARVFSQRSAMHGALSIILFGVIAVHSSPTQAAAPGYAEAYAVYERGKFAAAAKQFAQLPGYAARLAEGVSHYRAQAWQAAAASFIQATLEADTAQQRARVLFNLGNTYFKQAAYTEAAQIYRDVLRYAPDWRAAQINLEYARALQQQVLDEAPLARREGTGIRSAPVADNVDISQGRLSIDASEGRSQTPLALPDATDTASRELDLVQQAAPAATQVERDRDIRWTYTIDSVAGLQAQHTQFEVDERVIWQRLFESEEGFVAPQEAPHVVPGVRPW